MGQGGLVAESGGEGFELGEHAKLLLGLGGGVFEIGEEVSVFEVRISDNFGLANDLNCDVGLFSGGSSLFGSLCCVLLLLDEFKKPSFVKVTSGMVVGVRDAGKMQGLFQFVDVEIEGCAVDVHVQRDGQKHLELLLSAYIFYQLTHALPNERHRVGLGTAVHHFFRNFERHVDGLAVLRVQDLEDEVGELEWLNEILEQLIIKKRNYFVYDLQYADPKLWIYCRLVINQEYPWQ